MTCAASFSTLAHEMASGDKPVEAWVRVGRRTKRRRRTGRRAAGRRTGRRGLLLLGLRWECVMVGAAQQEGRSSLSVSLAS